MKLSCNVTRDLLPLYYDGVCSDESRALVEEHLADCAECGAILNELRGEIDLPHEQPDDRAVLKKLGKNLKRAWIRGAAAVLAVVLVVFAGVNVWWYVDTYSYYQRFAEGHELDANKFSPNRYQWSDGGYTFYVTVPDYLSSTGMLFVDLQPVRDIRNIVPGEEINVVLNFGREEYAYYVGLYITTRIQVPGQAHLKSETSTEFFQLDKDLNQIYEDYWDEETCARQAELFERYSREILGIIEAAQEQWPFLSE